MRMGFDAKRAFLNATGLGNYSRSLIGNLARFFPEEEYHLFTPRTGNPPLFSDARMPVHLPGNWPGALWRSFGVASAARKAGIKLYHGLSHELPLGLRRAGIRQVVTMHDVIFRRYPGLYPLADRLIYDAKWRYACQQADVVVAVSEATRQDLLNYYPVTPEKIQVIYQCCDDIFRLPPDPPAEKKVLARHQIPVEYLLYVGSLTERKNLLLLFQALQLLPEKDRLPVVVAGKGKAYGEKVQHWLRVQGMEKWALFRPDIPFADLPALYRHAQICVYPSHYEGFGIPVLEALTCGVPVITSATSSLPEAGGPGAAYISPGKPEELARHIHLILSDSLLREKMISQGKIHAERFAPEPLTRQLMNLYRSLL
ncbi:MAG: glycosyltransferase family 1 protein [Bacteroidetes bacterium]|nr:MAG: glycosyltransferase family 1 protein [Bacteroidota bacterium]